MRAKALCLKRTNGGGNTEGAPLAMSWSFCRGVPPSVVLASQVAPALKGRRHPLVDGIISSSISVT